ncbi:MAG: acyloxyacyl hydrolase [candidate division NC10 bacterium]|nr:acyloxyacyl hydrolase [candidate division NC10 bacterium]
MTQPCRLLLFATVLVMLLPGGGWAADTGAGPPAEQVTGAAQSPARLFGLGKQEIGIVVGHGLAIPIGRTTDDELRDVRYIYAAPRWGIGISDPMGGDAWYRGNLELLAEGTFIVNFEPKGGFGAGLTALFRYNFLPEGKFIPFVEAGGGILFLDMDFMNRSDDLNFNPQAGLGFHYFISERTAFTGEWRWQHISNGGIKEPNRGINSSLFTIGVSIFLE